MRKLYVGWMQWGRGRDSTGHRESHSGRYLLSTLLPIFLITSKKEPQLVLQHLGFLKPFIDSLSNYLLGAVIYQALH